MIIFIEDGLDERCKPGWKSYEGQCYYLGNQTISWFDAQSKCRSEGGDLITISNKPQQDFMTSFIGEGEFQHFLVY